MGANMELLQMQSSLNLTAEQLDPVYAALYQVSFDQLTDHAKPPAGTGSRPDEIAQWTTDQKLKALESILTPAQLETYRRQQAAQAELVKAIGDKMYGTNTVR